MRTLIVVSHPRDNSLTKQIANSYAKGIESNGGEVEILDLYRENFNPVTYIEDEADYNNIDKTYSDCVLKEMERIQSVDNIVFVFPIYWHSLPAMLKGYIDRVFNYGFAYGYGNKLPIDKIRWVALAGNVRAKYRKRGYDLNIDYQLNVGISDYVGVKDSEVEFIWDSLGDHIVDTHAREKHYEALNMQAYLLGRNL